jgi:hypothetical protein
MELVNIRPEQTSLKHWELIRHSRYCYYGLPKFGTMVHELEFLNEPAITIRYAGIGALYPPGHLQ